VERLRSPLWTALISIWKRQPSPSSKRTGTKCPTVLRPREYDVSQDAVAVALADGRSPGTVIRAYCHTRHWRKLPFAPFRCVTCIIIVPASSRAPHDVSTFCGTVHREGAENRIGITNAVYVLLHRLMFQVPMHSGPPMAKRSFLTVH